MRLVPPSLKTSKSPAWLFSCTLILAAAGLVGCAVESQRPDWDSGGDHKRDLAKRSPVGRAVTDSVDAGKGDHTDWKYIPVPGPGRMKLRVSVDNPKVGATILFIDNLGQPLGRARVDGKTRVYEFEEEVEEGKYFVKFQTAKFGSTYTVKTTFEPEQVAVVETVEPGKTKRRRRKKKDKPEDVAATPEEEGDAATTIVIVGKVVNKIPWADGKKTRITFDKGEVHGVKPGATAAISGGPTMKVKEVHESASVGIAKVKPAQISEGTKVTITVRSAGKQGI